MSLIRPEDIQSVLVLLSGPRSGSSFLFKQLIKNPLFYSPLGEETPFYKNIGLGHITSAEGSDRIAPEDLSQEHWPALFDQYAADLGVDGLSLTTTEGWEFWRTQMRRRLAWQLGHIADEFEPLLAQAKDASMWVELLRDLLVQKNMFGSYDSGEGAVFVPPLLIEDLPYVLPHPRDMCTAENIRGKTLVLKTSTNAYRIEVLRRLFPAAEIRWLVLTRNPLASINGIVDGWQSAWFHSHRVGSFAPLKITGYSKTQWWKFDAPPGWGAYTTATLEEVALFQWKSSYKSILESLTDHDRVLHVKLENILEAESNTFRELGEFTGVSGETLKSYFNYREVVMASQPPAPNRWEQQRPHLRDFLVDPEPRQLAKELGYAL